MLFRSSVVSLSKMLGYSPRSATCAQATVTVTVNTHNTTVNNLVLPAYSQFNTTIDGMNYTFFNRGSVNATSTTGIFTFQNVVITEGTPLNFNYTVGQGTRFVIPNPNIDLSTLTVRVQDSQTSSVYNTFYQADSLVNVDSGSGVYWVKEIDDGLYEVTFGDGLIGRALDNGNVVHFDYFVSSLDAEIGRAHV